MSSNGARRVPEVKGHHLEIHDQGGLRWATYRLTLPPDATMQDLTDHPSMLAGLRLRMDDTLRIVAHDRSWACECIVIDAAPGRVVLNKPRVLWSGQDARVGIEYQDQAHAIEWSGNGYSIWRKAKGNVARMEVAKGYSTLGSAKTALSKLYPQAM